MKRRIVVAIVVCVVASLPAVYAQKVVMDGAKVTIDCTSMPTGAVTTTPKARTTSGTNSTAAGTGLTDIASAASNEQVYQRFEVSKVDNSTGTKWKEAIDLCNGLTQDGTTGWRLPTQRELMLIWMLKPALEKQSVFTSFNTSIHYWSATTLSTTNCWYVSLKTGFTDTLEKTNNFNVRCIRDI